MHDVPGGIFFLGAPGLVVREEREEKAQAGRGIYEFMPYRGRTAHPANHDANEEKEHSACDLWPPHQEPPSCPAYSYQFFPRLSSAWLLYFGG